MFELFVRNAAGSRVYDKLFLQQDAEHPAERFDGAPEKLGADGEGSQILYPPVQAD
ncbi:MAG: hypothetical protein K9M45_05630 [Kiritimatiellales bacterium]|nr:hypothetical protein [Kiritimatiellales bacterium]